MDTCATCVKNDYWYCPEHGGDIIIIESDGPVGSWEPRPDVPGKGDDDE